MNIARINGNSTEQFIRASIALKDKTNTHVQFKLDDEFTKDMTYLLGMKGLNYHLKQVNGKYHFTVSLG